MGTVIKLIRDRTKLGLLSSFSENTTLLPLLDLYPNAAAAYSLRKLRNAYSGSAIRVRRSSDNAVLDIGFVDNVLDTASLLTFCGSGDGFVTIWYDQSLTGNNATQSSASSQPLIVEGGVIDMINSKPNIRLIGSKYLILDNTVLLSSATNAWAFFVSKPSNVIGFRYIFSGYLNLSTNADRGFTLGYDDTKPFNYTVRDLGFSSITGSNINNQSLQSFSADRVNLNNYLNGNLNNSTSDKNSNFSEINFNYLGGGPARISSGDIQELTLFNIDQSSNRTAIESNINNFYAIY